MKRILIYNLVGAILPLLILSVMVSITKSNGDIGYVALLLCLESIMFFNGLLVRKYRWLFYVIIVLTIISTVFGNIVFDNPFYAYPGIFFSGLLGYLVADRRMIYVLGPLFIFPTVFISFGINKISLMAYVVIICATLLFSIWLKHRKVRIYLYD